MEWQWGRINGHVRGGPITHRDFRVHRYPRVTVAPTLAIKVFHWPPGLGKEGLRRELIKSAWPNPVGQVLGACVGGIIGDKVTFSTCIAAVSIIGA